MTVHSLLALKQGLRAHLLARPGITAIIGQAVHETPLRGAKPPFIAFGEAELRDAGGSDAGGVIITFDLAIITGERGMKDALTLLSEVEAALDAPMSSLEGHHLVSLDHRQARVRNDAARTITRAGITLRAFLEPL